MTSIAAKMVKDTAENSLTIVGSVTVLPVGIHSASIAVLLEVGLNESVLAV